MGAILLPFLIDMAESGLHYLMAYSAVACIAFSDCLAFMRCQSPHDASFLLATQLIPFLCWAVYLAEPPVGVRISPETRVADSPGCVTGPTFLKARAEDSTYVTSVAIIATSVPL